MCENDQLLRRAQQLQLEKDELEAAISSLKKDITEKDFLVEDLKAKCADLRESLIVADRDREWCRNELMLLSAKMEVVELIFGHNRSGGRRYECD